MSKPSRRSSPIRVRVCFGLLDQSALKQTSMMHLDSIFDDPRMDGKIISYAKQWLLFEAKIPSESMGIIETNYHLESVRALRRHLLGRLGHVTCRDSLGT
jgi:hypothetical protein